MLDEYQMIIIGFADGFGKDTIPNDNKEVDAICEFIEKGKSVILHMIPLLLLTEKHQDLMKLQFRLICRKHGSGDIH